MIKLIPEDASFQTSLYSYQRRVTYSIKFPNEVIRISNKSTIGAIRQIFEEGPHKGTTRIWWALEVAVYGTQWHQKYILEKFGDQLIAQDFTAIVDDGLYKGTTGLWVALRAAAHEVYNYGSPRALDFILDKFGDQLTLDDFRAKAEDGPHKGETGLWMALRGAVNENPKALNFILKNFGDQLTVEDFRAKAEGDHHKGQTGMWLAVAAAVNGCPDPLNFILKNFGNDLTLADFRDKTDSRYYKGHTGLLLALMAADQGHSDAFRFISEKFGHQLTLEDFRAKARKNPYDYREKTGLSIACMAAAKRHYDPLNFLCEQISGELSEQELNEIIKVKEDRKELVTAKNQFMKALNTLKDKIDPTGADVISVRKEATLAVKAGYINAFYDLGKCLIDKQVIEGRYDGALLLEFNGGEELIPNPKSVKDWIRRFDGIAETIDKRRQSREAVLEDEVAPAVPLLTAYNDSKRDQQESPVDTQSPSPFAPPKNKPN